MPKLPDKDVPSNEEIIAEARKAIEFLREACPLPYRVREISVKPKLKGAWAELAPVPDADGGPVTDIVLSRVKLAKEWREVVWTRIFPRMG